MIMTQYSPATIAKAAVAFITAFGGAAATSAPHDAIGWAGCAGAGLVAFAAVFATPNKSHEPVQSPAEQLANSAAAWAAQQAQHVADGQTVQTAIEALGQVPVVGPLTQEIIAGAAR